MFGINTKSKGYNTKLCIIGNGAAGHNHIKDPTDMEVLLKNCDDPNDNIGQSILEAGVIAGNNKKIISGMTPKTQLYYAKSIDDKQNSKINDIAASLLWSITHKIDVIILNVFPDKESNYFDNILSKAKKLDTTILVRSCDINKKWNQNKKIISVDTKNGAFKIDVKPQKNKCTVFIPNEKFYSTYLIGAYAQIQKEDLAISLLAGLFLIGYQKFGGKNKNFNSYQIIDKLLS